MGALAGWPDCQTNLMRRAATTADAPGDGQPGWTPDGVLCGVVVRTRDYAAVHTAERIVVEHDLVNPLLEFVDLGIGPGAVAGHLPLRSEPTMASACSTTSS